MSVTWNKGTLTLPWIPLIDSPAMPMGNLHLLIHNNKLPHPLILYWLLSVAHCINPIVSTTVKPASWIINGHISKASCHFHYWGELFWYSFMLHLNGSWLGCGRWGFCAYLKWVVRHIVNTVSAMFYLLIVQLSFLVSLTVLACTFNQ